MGHAPRIIPSGKYDETTYNTIRGNFDDLFLLINRLSQDAEAIRLALGQLGSDPVTSLPWSAITGKPTTISGYKITDAASIFHGVDTGYVPFALTPTTWGATGLYYDAANGRYGFGFTSPLSTVCVNGGVHIGGESAVSDNNLLVDNNVQAASLTVAAVYAGFDVDFRVGGAAFGSTQGSTYIANNAINSGYLSDLDDYSLGFNYAGKSAGISKFRDTIIYDGKNTAVVTVDGSSKYVGLQRASTCFFDIYDSTGLATVPHIIGAGLGIAHGMTTYAGTTDFFQVLNANTGSGASDGGVILRGLSGPSGTIPSFAIHAFGGGTDYTTYPLLLLNSAKKSGTGVGAAAATDILCQWQNNFVGKLTLYGNGNLTTVGALQGTGATLTAMTTAGVVHNAVTTGLLSSSLIVAADVTANTLTYACLQQVSANNRVLGNVSGGAGNVSELTAANLKTMCGYYTSGDSPSFAGITHSGFGAAGIVVNSAAGVLATDALGTADFYPVYDATGLKAGLIQQNAAGTMVGVGVAPSVFIDAQKDQNVSTAMRIRNDTNGTASQTSLILCYGNYTTNAILETLSPSFTASGLHAGSSVCLRASGATAGMRVYTEDATNLILGTSSAARITIAAAGAVTIAGALGCNGATAQTPYVLGAAATDGPTSITLANNLRLMAIAFGFGVNA